MSFPNIDSVAGHTDENQPGNKWTEEDLSKYIVSKPPVLLKYDSLPETIEISEQRSKEIYSMCEYTLNPRFAHANQHFYGTAYINSVSDVISANPLYNVLIYRQLNCDSYQIVESYPPPPEFVVPILDQTRYQEGKAQAYMFINPSGALLTLRTRETSVLYRHPYTNLNDVKSIPMPPNFRTNIHPTSRFGPLHAAKTSMKHFLSACEFYNLGVFAAQYNSGKLPIILKRLNNITEPGRV